EQKKDMNERNVKDIEKQMQELREQWIKQNSQEFDHESECSCPTCGQDLPEEQIEETKANFNRNKSELLETINAKGIELKIKLNQLSKKMNRFNQKSTKLIKKLRKRTLLFPSLKVKLSKLNQLLSQLMKMNSLSS